MATVSEALDSMVDELDTRGGFSYNHVKAQNIWRRERTLLAKRLLQFLGEVDEDLTVMEVRQALEEEIPA